MDKKELMGKIELFIDRIIPHLVFIIFVMLIIELVYYKNIEPYLVYINTTDYFIIFVFWVDLMFKYNKVRVIPLFLRKYWIDLLAVFPFFLVFRLFQSVYSVAIMPQLLSEPQKLIHDTVVLEREGMRLVRAAEKTEKLSRTRLLLRFAKPLARIPRLVKIVPYFERPTPEHHQVINELSKEKAQEKKGD